MTLFKPLMAAGLALLLPAAALADSASINVTGRILSSACQPEVNPLNVPLGTLSQSALAGKGSTASATRFTLRLKNCPAEISQVQVRFDGGVGIQLQDANAAVLRFGQPSAAMAIQGGAGSVSSLAFTARYIAISDSVSAGSAGSANASATFTILYSN
ncbi:fimbrial protein [Serratia quinivorans]|uniref:fimbrial protein n=1 Tax=Serratia quinivorans TaxID=137545 RepID=UPI00217AB0C3|nr:fimbrial protein [Serratia quinivorans]CAI0924142.1 S-fimbrial protein subunit SfaG precursor [Serratia quinivorans]